MVASPFRPRTLRDSGGMSEYERAQLLGVHSLRFPPASPAANQGSAEPQRRHDRLDPIPIADSRWRAGSAGYLSVADNLRQG